MNNVQFIKNFFIIYSQTIGKNVWKMERLITITYKSIEAEDIELFALIINFIGLDIHDQDVNQILNFAFSKKQNNMIRNILDILTKYMKNDHDFFSITFHRTLKNIFKKVVEEGNIDLMNFMKSNYKFNLKKYIWHCPSEEILTQFIIEWKIDFSLDYSLRQSSHDFFRKKYGWTQNTFKGYNENLCMNYLNIYNKYYNKENYQWLIHPSSLCDILITKTNYDKYIDSLNEDPWNIDKISKILYEKEKNTRK